MIAVVAVSGFVTYFVLNHASSNQAVSFKAAIIDQLSGTIPDPSFNDNAKNLLLGAGYAVDYYSPDQVTVDFFRSLPSKGYGLIIIRAHSTGWIPGDPVAIFTSEPYIQSSYLYEQLTDQLGNGRLDNDKTYFEISAKFVQDAMQGRFPNSIIVMMGCTGLKNSDMAQAFVSRGAGVYVSWDKAVSKDRTDGATLDLLRSLVGGRTVRDAVTSTMGILGPDTVYGSQLAFYPNDKGGLVLPVRTMQAPMLGPQNSLQSTRPAVTSPTMPCSLGCAAAETRRTWWQAF
jgi:hypothetical protein